MSAPAMSPMIHAVHALVTIDEKLGDKVKRGKLHRVSQYGDVVNAAGIGPLPIDEIVTIAFTVPNASTHKSASWVMDRFTEPAARELAGMVMDHDLDSRMFARLALPPVELGAQAFRADHNDLSVLCEMAYDMDGGGVRFKLGMLYTCYGEK